MKGSEDNIAHFEWNEEYQDFINRFESWVDVESLKNPQDLYDNLHSWLGITKKGVSLPSQKQMDFFTEYYKQDLYDIGEVKAQEEAIRDEAPQWQYESGDLYNPYANEFRKKTDTGFEYHSTYERVMDMPYGRRIVICDSKTHKMLKHRKDVINDKELGSQY